MNKKGKYSLIFAIFIACILMTGIAVAEKGDTKPECKDKIDNDGDGLIDRKDGGCTGPNDNDESNCGDGECEGGETSSSCLADCGVSDSCSDTDGGNAITVFGTTSGYLDDVSYSNTDSCVDSSTIKEYYCSGSYEYSASQSCGSDTYSSNYCSGNYIYKDITDYFCSSGECDNTVTSQVQDNCDSYDASGTDYCSNGDVYNDYTDYYCSSGACDSSTTQQLVESCTYGCTSGECVVRDDSCSDSDGGITTNIYGTTLGYLDNVYFINNDYCVDSSTVMEYYCSGDYEYSTSQSCGTDGNGSNYCSMDKIYRDYTDYFCSLGKCSYITTPYLQQDCNLLDNYGSNYCSNGDIYKDYNDYSCSSGDCDSSTTAQIVETCANGCSDGTCITYNNNCTDSDGGYVPAVKGYTYGMYEGETYDYADYCQSTTTLIEYYCSGSLASNYAHDCNGTTSCINGACK